MAGRPAQAGSGLYMCSLMPPGRRAGLRAPDPRPPLQPSLPLPAHPVMLHRGWETLLPLQRMHACQKGQWFHPIPAHPGTWRVRTRLVLTFHSSKLLLGPQCWAGHEQVHPTPSRAQLVHQLQDRWEKPLRAYGPPEPTWASEHGVPVPAESQHLTTEERVPGQPQHPHMDHAPPEFHVAVGILSLCAVWGDGPESLRWSRVYAHS